MILLFESAIKASYDSFSECISDDSIKQLVYKAGWVFFRGRGINGSWSFLIILKKRYATKKDAKPIQTSFETSMLSVSSRKLMFKGYECEVFGREYEKKLDTTSKVIYENNNMIDFKNLLKEDGIM